ncbi:uncharacterized protein LOC122926745 isoform X1 [Bufo gargarizans]|uniref:uncharacterized protein LOC122926745 isoform X1 n=1 Tax=Bufo gargarizans TaxID=30331 RepID=UPI001CF497F1|nr:uncharacterized protein LOC122926745 isoform X1 [Bufo gargarizans]
MSAPGLSVEEMLERLRREAEVRGPGWLQEQVGACIVSPAPVASPNVRAARPRRGIPPARLSPEVTPRARRRVGSPSVDPRRRGAAARASASRSRRGRNPDTRRGPVRSGTPLPPLPAAVQQDSGPGTVDRPSASFSVRSTRLFEEDRVPRTALVEDEYRRRSREDLSSVDEGPLAVAEAAVSSRCPASVVQRVVQVVQEEQPSTSRSYDGAVSVRQESGPSAAGVTAPVVPVGAVPASCARSGGGGSAVSGVAVGDPGREVMGLLRDSLSPGTWREYGKAWTTWEAWNGTWGAGGVDGEVRLLMLLGQLKSEGWSVSRVNHLVSGIAFGFKWRGLADLTKSFLVRQVLKGWRRGAGRVPDCRRPVSFELLVQMGDRLSGVCSSGWELGLFKAAFALAFFGAFRLGELVCGSVRRAGGLRSEDVEWVGDRLHIRIRRSKTDQEGRGLRFTLFAVPGCSMCPVRCAESYGARLGRDEVPFLRHEDGSFLSRFQFLAVFRKCLTVLGVPVKDYSGHSFRIGAATEAARVGASEEVIRRIGRWESVRFKSYVRPALL